MSNWVFSWSGRALKNEVRGSGASGVCEYVLPSPWRGIETAPKDGTWIVLAGGSAAWHDEDGEATEDDPGNPAVVARWDTEWAGGAWVFAFWDGAWRSVYFNPTHWMPLTVPQKEEKK